MLILIVLLATSPFYIISSVYAQGTITGYVRDQYGVGIRGASIVVSYSGGGTVTDTSATSGNSGTFAFYNMPNGMYTLTASATGYSNGYLITYLMIGVTTISNANITLQSKNVPNPFVPNNANNNTPSTYDIPEIVVIAVLVMIILLCAYLASIRQKVRALEGRVEDQIKKHEDASLSHVIVKALSELKERSEAFS